MHIVLKGLPISWGPFVSMFGADLSRTPKPTYSSLVERLQSEEYWRKGKQIEATEEAMAVTRQFGRGRGRFQPRNDGHYQPHGNAPGNFRFPRPNPNPAGRGKRPGNCNYCSKTGHWEANCDLKKLDDQIADLQLKAAGIRRF